MTTLRRRMMEDMQLRNLAQHTQEAYVQQVSQFARHFNRSPELLGPEEIRSYQVYLKNERKLAPSSIILAVAALRFLYKITLHKVWSLEEVIPTPKIPQKLPIVLSPEEVVQFLGSVRCIKHRTILTVCYAAGLRVSEAICLKVTDIDSKRMVIRVEQGKGRMDRYVMLSAKLLQILRNWWRVDRRPEGALSYTNDYKIAATSRAGLLLREGVEISPEGCAQEIQRLFGRSLKLRSVSAGGCNGCELELNALGNVNFDMGRFGIEFVASPRHADGIVLSGTTTRNMEHALAATYEAVPAPKLVVLFGACAISGGIYQGSDQLARKYLERLKIDLYIPGCPPHPLTFIYGLLTYLRKTHAGSKAANP